MQDILDSEDEFHQANEKLDFDNYSDSSQDNQVLALDDSDYSEDERLLSKLQQQIPTHENSDDESDQASDDLEPQGWGDKKKLYYNADQAYDSEDSEKQDQEEEIEARKLQTKFSLQEDDYIDDFQDSFENIQKQGKKTISSENQTSIEDSEIIEHDLSLISPAEKQKLLEKFYSDVIGMMDQFNDISQDIHELSKVETLDDSDSNQKIHSFKLQLSLIYASLIKFYLYMRSKEKQLKKIENHPIIEMMMKVQDLLEKCDEFDEQNEQSDDESLPEEMNEETLVDDELSEDESINESLQESQAESESESQSESELTLANLETNEDEDYYQEIKSKTKKRKLSREEAVQEMKQQAIENRIVDNDELHPDGKRKATWKILANKGLTPFRKKENRNPRVKKRLRYEKAVKKLSSYKRVVVDKKKVGAYQGEMTGIKKNLSRSVQF